MIAPRQRGLATHADILVDLVADIERTLDSRASTAVSDGKKDIACIPANQVKRRLRRPLGLRCADACRPLHHIQEILSGLAPLAQVLCWPVVLSPQGVLHKKQDRQRQACRAMPHRAREEIYQVPLSAYPSRTCENSQLWSICRLSLNDLPRAGLASVHTRLVHKSHSICSRHKHVRNAWHAYIFCMM